MAMCARTMTEWGFGRGAIFYMEQCRLFSRPGMRLHQISLKEIGREQGTNTNQR